MNLPYGGMLSEPIMLLGQDEAIFKQFIFSCGAWVMDDDSKQMQRWRPEGDAIIIVSREIGYNFTPSQSVLDRVNAAQKNCQYSDAEK